MEQVPLLQAKLYIPPVRSELVSRPRLIERLNEGLGQSQGFRRKLTLISAPAGFGKTTLVSEWVHTVGMPMVGAHRDVPLPAAWLSLDERDNDFTRFLTYLVAALQTLALPAPRAAEGSKAEGLALSTDGTSGVEEIAAQQSPVGSIGEGVLSMLQSPGAADATTPPPTESILTALLNEITILDDFILVLDDYHVIEAESVNNALTFLLEHLPPHMHLVIVTREDPDLPLARLRVRGQLTELRITDLRSTPSEAAEFFNQVMGLNLSPEQVTSLEIRTEGWIAGLQLAALSMRGRDDVSGFIRAFAGDNRYVVDYLVEEVLQRQPERVRSFLLQTSILERLTGPLCDAVCFGKAETHAGQQDGRGMLEALERGNLFVVPLDDRRQWYRYHHLFADVLQAHLMEEQPDQVPVLHRRASEWYEGNGSPADAVRHALAAEDYERAADVAELAWQAMDDTFQSATWIDWVKHLPEELIRTRPVLCTQYAWALWLGGELEASETRLRDAERWLDPAGDMSTRPERMVVVDEEQFRKLPASIALVRTYNAEAQGDVSATVKYAELALKLTPEEDHIERAQATVSLGFTYWMSGDLEAARRALTGWIDSMQKAGNIVFAIASTYPLADIMIAQGRLQEAVRAYKQSLQLASEHDQHVERVIAHLYLGLAMLYHEMGDQEATAQHLQKSRELGEQSTLPDWPYRWCLAQARLKETQGDLEAALDLLDEAKRQYIRSTLPDIRPVEALKARVYVRQGRVPKALAWARERGLSVDDELSYLREFEHITLARVLIAEYESSRAERSVLQATGLLERLLKAARDARRMGSVLEILVLQALAHQAQSNIPHAPDRLERALALAEPEGYFLAFVDEGPPMAQLLHTAAAQGIMPDYTAKLLAAFQTMRQGTGPSSALVEPLSERELQVLRLLGTELNGPEIARELVVSLSTMRTHTRNIYGKLGVNNRRAAVRRAKELELL